MADDLRIDELRQLGLSEPVIRMAMGEVVHDALWWICLPLSPVVAEPPTPSGSHFVPLWSFAGGITGAMVRDDGKEFADYAIDCLQEGFEFVAHTEQGLLAYLLSHLVHDQLVDVSEAVGFRFPAELRVHSDIQGLRSLIGRIDSECETAVRAEQKAAGDGGM